jgi:hypothetical protein
MRAMRAVVALLGLAALLAVGCALMFVARMTYGFGIADSQDAALLVGMFLATLYFGFSVATTSPRFPVTALFSAGVVLHLVLMPLSILLVCFALGAKQAFYLAPCVIFALLWFFMARLIVEDLR